VSSSPVFATAPVPVMMSLVTSFVGAAPLGTVIFGSVESGPELGTEAAFGVVGDVADVVGVVVVGTGTVVGGGFSVCAWSGAGMMWSVSA
jgi:hypothetical protein